METSVPVLGGGRGPVKRQGAVREQADSPPGRCADGRFSGGFLAGSQAIRLTAAVALWYATVRLERWFRNQGTIGRVIFNT
jgi:hypothetical protein